MLNIDLSSDYQYPPYFVLETPEGPVVSCKAHRLSEPMKPAEAQALVASLNTAYIDRNAGK